MSKFLERKNSAKLGLELFDKLYRNFGDDNVLSEEMIVTKNDCRIYFSCTKFSVDVVIENSGVCHTGFYKILDGRLVYYSCNHDNVNQYPDTDSVVNMISSDLKELVEDLS